MKKKTIKGNRIIRFRKPQENNKQVSDEFVNEEKIVEEKPEQITKKEIVEEKPEQITKKEIVEEKSERITTNEIVEKKSEQVNTEKQGEEEQKKIRSHEESKIYKAYEELKDTVQNVMFDRQTSNMIGIFGENADNAVKMLYRESGILTKENELGYTLYGKGIDIYDRIAADLESYIQKQFSTSWYFSIYYLIQHVYSDPKKEPYSEYEDEKSKMRLQVIRQCQRAMDILEFISKIKLKGKIDKYFIIVELHNVDCDVLYKLSKLNDSNLVIIVHCDQSISTINKYMSYNIYGDYRMDVISKFFKYTNCIEAV